MENKENFTKECEVSSKVLEETKFEGKSQRVGENSIRYVKMSSSPIPVGNR